MKNVFSFVWRYFNWRNDCLGKPPYFPLWCDTGAASAARDTTLRHHLGEDGAVVWDVSRDARLPHADHMEMSGFFVSCIASYGADARGRLRMHRHLVFPMLRMLPNDTRGSLSHNFLKPSQAVIWVNGRRLKQEYPQTVTLNGYLDIVSHTDCGVTMERRLMPAVNFAAAIEKISLVNIEASGMDIEIAPPGYRHVTRASKGVAGTYEIVAGIAADDGRFDSRNNPRLRFRLEPGQRASFYQVYCAAVVGETIAFHAALEEREREAFIASMHGRLRLETPEPVLNAAFDFAKIRACESIFRTRNGLMHSPGGGSFYAAMWTNDQCEYTSPVFSFIGYSAANEEAKNCFRLYMQRMDADLNHPLVSSIVAEGEGFWNGAGDRGDGAMFAYGAARFALASGDAALASLLWDGIVWGIEYSLKQKNEFGAIRSDSDELENRFLSGNANLFTSCLVYDALKSAAMLSTELHKDPAVAERYNHEAQLLHHAIERYFGANVQGFDTYRYYEGNRVLRAWICVPLATGIFDRAAQTIEALFSDKLWTDDGLRTQAGNDTFWDRATLYALRGVFAAGKSELALRYLLRYSQRRLLGEHVPYAVEAWPEGNQKHLSAESALYLRVFTEGLFGIRPVGLKRFELRPQLPPEWDRMALRDVMAFGSRFDIEAVRTNSSQSIRVTQNGAVIFEAVTNGDEAVIVTLN